MKNKYKVLGSSFFTIIIKDMNKSYNSIIGKGSVVTGKVLGNLIF